MGNYTWLEELAEAFYLLPTCGSHQYDYSCKDCVKLAHPDSQTVEGWAGLPTEDNWQQWEQEQAEVSERLTLKADAFDKAMSDPDSIADPLVPSSILFGEIPPPPAGYWNVGWTDKPILYDRTVSTIYGPAHTGKSWAALIAAKAAMDHGIGHKVAYLDFEDSHIGMSRRLAMLGIGKQYADRFRYYRGDLIADKHRVQIAEWAAGDDGEGLVVLDSAGASGAPDSGPDGFLDWWMEHVTPYKNLADDKRPAVLILDHSPLRKDPNRTHGAIGSARKIAMIDGIAIEIVTGQEACWSREKDGRITLVARKDRNGYWQGGERMATIRGSWKDDAFAVIVEEPEEETKPEAMDTLQIEDCIAETIILSMPEGIAWGKLYDTVKAAVPTSKKMFGSVLKRSVESGEITRQKRGRSTIYTIADSLGLDANVVPLPPQNTT